LSYLLSYPDDDGDRDNSSFFADDNPLSHVTAKLERGGERRYEFSGPLGDKIKESLNAAPPDQDTDRERDRDRDRDSMSVSPLSTHLTPAADPIPEKQQVAVAAKMVPKVNILKVPRRSIGSVTSLSLDDQTLHSYAKDDYANYAIGDILHHDVEWYIEPWINLLW
jgi:hypothetical protein